MTNTRRDAWYRRWLDEEAASRAQWVRFAVVAVIVVAVVALVMVL